MTKGGSTYWPQFPVGTTFTDGLQTFVVSGTRPATIEDVEILGATPGMRLLGASIAGAKRRVGAIEILKRYPPTNRLLGPVRPATGYVVPPGPLGVELLIGLQITAPGVQKRTGIRVIYTVGAQTYQADFRAAIINRPPKS